MLASWSFVHPNSRYIGKFFTLFTTVVGYYVHVHYVQAYNASRRFGNFHNYPTDIQRMIDNNDSRYAWKWLKDSYHDIAREDLDAPWNDEHKEKSHEWFVVIFYSINRSIKWFVYLIHNYSGLFRSVRFDDCLVKKDEFCVYSRDVLSEALVC